MLLRRADMEDDVLLANILELYAAAVEPLSAALVDDGHKAPKADREHASIRNDAIIQAAKTQVAARPKHRAAEDARRLRDIVEMIKADPTRAVNQERRE
jgi:hypothetical protein